MDKKEAYKIVFEDLKQSNLFTGHYDAKNGNEHYMYGISVVMEFIAYGIDDSTGRDFADKFMENMIASEKSVQVREQGGKRRCTR